jgi:hypothetical protein
MAPDKTPANQPERAEKKAPESVVFPASCQTSRALARRLLEELAQTLSAEAKSSPTQYVAKPGPGVSAEKAWSDFAAGAALFGDVTLATWAGLTAADVEWTGETVTNAGVYLFYLGKAQEALQLLICAYAMGERSPFLFEALATVHHKLGHTNEATQAITRAHRLAPDDRLIETTKSFLTTGRPPAASSQSQQDPLDAAIRELEAHAARALNDMKRLSEAVDRSLPDSQARAQYDIQATYFRDLLEQARDQARTARRADARTREHLINSVLSLYIAFYAAMTDALLTFPSSMTGSPVLFWAGVLSLDAPALARESRRDALAWSMHGTPGPALAQGAKDAYNSAWERGYAAFTARERACGSEECLIRERARWCGEWKPLYERWENDSQVRHNKAARSFDRIATRTVIDAENELLMARDYAVRQVKQMKFPKAPGMDLEKMTLQGINATLSHLFDKHLSSSGGALGTAGYVQERATWFEVERTGMDSDLSTEAEKLKGYCEPVMAAYLELLLQEEWQAYLEHLRDRIAWGIQGQAETGEFPCDVGGGPFKLTADLNKPGEGKMDIKWSRKGNPISITGSVGVRQDQTVVVGVGVSGKKSWDRDPGPDSIEVSAKGDSVLGPAPEAGGCYGPFCGKAKVNLTNKVSPWNSRDYLGIKLKGSAGLGLRQGSAGFACYPSNGSVTFYPRAVYEDTIRYLSTPSTPPR